MKSLVEIFSTIGNNTGIDIGCNDKGGIHTYLETYDKLFAPFRNGCTMMEIGLAIGDSIRLWKQYFLNSYIVGVDIAVVFDKSEFENDFITICQYDATTKEFYDSLLDVTFDIIIDDGSHMEADQIKTFNLLKDKMNPGGIYIIEDILALDQNRHRFEALHTNCEIVDMRSNGRFDNVLIIYKF